MDNLIKEDNLKFSHKIVEYLKTRYHTEAPHISLLSPEYLVLPKIFKKRGTILELSDEEDIDDELIETLDPTKIRGHSTFGVKATFKNYTRNSSARFETHFYIRSAPGANFKRVQLTALISGEDKLKVELNVFTEYGSSPIYSSPPIEVDLRNTPSVIIGFGTEGGNKGKRGLISTATEFIKRALYGKNSSLFVVSGKDIEDALGTEMNKERAFWFAPGVRRGNKILYCSSNKYIAVQNFLLEVSKQKIKGNVRLSFVLRYIGPALLNGETRKLMRLDSEYKIPLYVYYPDNSGGRLDRWAIYHLFEVEGELNYSNVEKAWGWIKETEDSRKFAGLYNLEPIGSLAIDSEKESKVILRDWNIETEEVYPVEPVSHDLKSSFTQVFKMVVSEIQEKTEGYVDSESLREAFNIIEDILPKIGVTSLRKFQEESLYEGLKNLLTENERAIVLEARTAGGKTLSFLLPILVYSLYKKLKGEDDGTKAILIYPTTALQNDQATTLFNLLWHINIELKQRYNTKYAPLSLGLLYGPTPTRTYIRKTVSELRLPCPLCNGRLQLEFKIMKTETGRQIGLERIVCSEKNCPLNQPDSEEYQLLQHMIRATREAIYSSPPDFIIANPDILNARLTLASKEDPASLSILGKEVQICANCGTVHDHKGAIRKCRVCGAKKLEKRKFGYPKIIVIDEAHLFRGAFGAQVSHLLTRLEQAIRTINDLPETWRPMYFISSATLNNPLDRATELVSFPKNKIVQISAKLDKNSVPTKRVHVFIMPKRYSPEATVSRVLEAIYRDVSAIHPSVKAAYNQELEDLRRKLFSSKPTGKPTTLVFVNRISEANDLLNYARLYLGDTGVRMDGHTTDFKPDRIKVEDEFSKGNLDLVIATSGLEVGVDFDLVDIGVLYGMPFYIADYTQRIGRIGRKRHSIVFNIFLPDKPVDYFYHKNWKLMSNGYLRDIHIMNETYVINRENIYAIKKAGKAAVLDMISTHKGAETELDKAISGKEWDIQVNLLNNSLMREASWYVPRALRINGNPDLANIAITAAKDLINALIVSLPTTSKLREAIKKNRRNLDFIRNLRDVEEQTEYNFNFPSRFKEVGTRPRSTSYSFRHCVPGQIISYRGFYFVISAVDSRIIDIKPEEK